MSLKINRSKHRRFIRKIVEAVVVLSLTAIMFDVFKNMAYAERGYAAIGGEYCILFFPMFWSAVKSVVKDACLGMFSIKNQERQRHEN